MHKKLSVIAFLFLLFPASIFADTKDMGERSTSSLIPLTARERAWLDAHPNIQLGATTTYPPLVIKHGNGSYSGGSSGFC